MKTIVYTEKKKPQKISAKKDLITLFLVVITAGILIALNPVGVAQRLYAENKTLATTLHLDQFISTNQSFVVGTISQDGSTVAARGEIKLVTRDIPKQRANKIAPGAKYLIIGDSQMQYGLGSEIENALLSRNAKKVFRKAIQSTGLLHPERLNWYNEVDKLTSSQKYDVAIVSFGLNDADFIIDPDTGYIYQFGDKGWYDLYAEKVGDMLYKLLVEHKIKKVVWVGLPISKTDFWNNAAKNLNTVYKKEVSNYINAIYIDTYNRLSDNGQFSDYATNDQGERDIARTPDGNHVTPFGGRILSSMIMKQLTENGVKFK